MLLPRVFLVALRLPSRIPCVATTRLQRQAQQAAILLSSVPGQDSGHPASDKEWYLRVVLLAAWGHPTKEHRMERGAPCSFRRRRAPHAQLYHVIKWVLQPHADNLCFSDVFGIESTNHTRYFAMTCKPSLATIQLFGCPTYSVAFPFF
jgi:hypothetical protein